MDVGGKKKPTKVPFHLGITNCVLGLISIVLSAAAMSLPSNIFHGDWRYNILGTGEGVWCGIFAIATGILGILTEARPSVSIYTLSGVLGILSAIISLVGFSLSVLGVLVYGSTLYLSVALMSLNAVVGTMCLSMIPVCIVQTVFSFRDKHYNAVDGKARILSNGYGRTYTAESSSTTKIKYARYFLGLGVVEVTLGVVLFGFDVGELWYTLSVREMVDRSWLARAYSGIGIWGGLFICASGALGVLYKFRPSSTVINANMALCMLSATASFVIVVIYVVAAVTIDKRGIEYHAVSVASGFIAMIVCIVHSAFCCGGVCQRQKVDGRYGLVASRDVHDTASL